ncbi:tetratricopeptide repeat protein [Candidatus Uhrbacteria bacterium]|nr:tetratricopeptide repeat protein [Candidatus Uhrbacteria bacterium]
MSITDQLSKAYLKAAWSLDPRSGIRNLKNIKAATKEEKELKWCYLGFMYDHLANPLWPKIRKEMEAAARHAYRQALRLNPKCTMAMIGLGRILINRKDPRALKWYRKAFQVDPKGSKVEFSLAYAYFQLGKFKEAECLIKRLRRRDPSDFGCVYNLAQLNVARGIKKQARHYAKVALRLFRSKPRKERSSEGGRRFQKAMMEIVQDLPASGLNPRR